MHRFPSDIVADIEREISVHEEDLAKLVGSNFLMQSDEQQQAVYEKQLVIGYLREHGKTNALLEYAHSLLSEILPLKINLHEHERKDELSKIRREISKQKNKRQNYNQALDAAREIIGEQPNLFRGGGKYSELARRVCRKLKWHEKKERTVRRDLRAAEIIPESD